MTSEDGEPLGSLIRMLLCELLLSQRNVLVKKGKRQMIKVEMNENGGKVTYGGSVEQICNELGTAISTITEAMNEDVPGSGDTLLEYLKDMLCSEREGQTT